MWYCNECGNYFDEPGTTRELMGEYFGSPAYETFGTCPECGSTDIEEAKVCPVCGEPHREDGDFCVDCLRNLEYEFQSIKERYGIDEEVLDDWIIEQKGW